MKTEQLLIAIGIVFLFFFIVLPVFSPWSISNNAGYQMMQMMSGGMFVGMSLTWLLLVVFLILGIIWFLTQLQQKK